MITQLFAVTLLSVTSRKLPCRVSTQGGNWYLCAGKFADVIVAIATTEAAILDLVEERSIVVQP
jgi:hypothetical protein